MFGWIGGSGLEIGVLGDALMASHDVNVAISSGAATPLERQTVRWTGDFVGFGAGSDGLMAAGGTISNLTALTAARERALPGIRYDGASAAAHGDLLLGRGALLGAPCRRGPRHRRAQRALDRARTQQADGRRRLRRRDRRRPPRGHRAGRGRRHRGHDADRGRRRPPGARRGLRRRARSGSTSTAPTGSPPPRPGSPGTSSRASTASTRRPSTRTSGCMCRRPAASCSSATATRSRPPSPTTRATSPTPTARTPIPSTARSSTRGR